jgi:hypothetical protein
LIIPVQRGNSLEEYLTEEQESRPVVVCPLCSGRLWAHGSRVRTAENLKVCVLVEIVRKLCPRCNRTFSLIPDFLEAGKRFSKEVSEEYVTALVFDDATYRSVAWSDDDMEREDASASLSRVFRAVEEAANAASSLLMELHQKQLALDESTDDHEPDSKQCRATRMARAPGKARLLQVLEVLFSMLAQTVGANRRSICARYRRLVLDFRFPTPPAMKHKLF